MGRRKYHILQWLTPVLTIVTVIAGGIMWVNTMSGIPPRVSDTEEALKLMGEESTEWLDKEDNLVELTVTDIQYIRLNLILASIRELWIVNIHHIKLK